MAKLPKHMLRSGPPTVEPINKISAMGISHKEPQKIERKFSSVEEIQNHFRVLENSVLRLNNAKEKHPRMLAPVEVHEIAKAIRISNKKTNLREDQIEQLTKNEIKKRNNEIAAKRIKDLINEIIPNECESALSLVKNELNKKQNSGILKNICNEHIRRIVKYNSANISLSKYIEQIRNITGIGDIL